MTRAIIVNGPCLVKVQGASNSSISSSSELGLADGQIVIAPRFHHKGIYTDDFGDDIAADVQWMLADCTISMRLVHFDESVLLGCLNESMAGGTEGTMVGAGTLMGGFVAQGQQGNHYINVTLTSPMLNKPWIFPTAYLAEYPAKIPLGTERSLVDLTWRAVPYWSPVVIGSVFQSAGGDPVSNGAVLWHH